MTVYVDQFPEEGWGRWNGGGHMLGNDLEELHRFAARIGCQRQWFQAKRHAHYDLTKAKRLKAIRLGAVELAWGEIPRDCLMRDDKADTRRVTSCAVSAGSPSGSSSVRREPTDHSGFGGCILATALFLLAGALVVANLIFQWI